MNIISMIIGIIGKIFASVFTDIAKDALNSPATKEETHAQEGNASPVGDSDYDGLYGSRMHNRGEADK